MAAAVNISREIRLPCGLVLPNRIAKSATSEALADLRSGRPTEALIELYRRWGSGGAGMLITGEVMFDLRGRSEPGNVVVSDGRDLPLLRHWADVAQAQGARAFLQVNHAGRQSPRRISREPVAPSAIALRRNGLFARPRALTESEITGAVSGYARVAEIAAEAGFAGVQVHAAHGYLINQFLSPLTNHRTDGWGGSPEARMRFLLEIVRAVRTRVGSRVAISVKLNSADFQRGGFSEEQSMEVVAALEREGIDLLEISGGNFERMAMMGTERPSTRSREAYFLDYAERVRRTTRLPLMLTGGLRTARAMDAVVGEAVDIVGMARPMAVEPDLPARLLSGEAASALDVAPRVGVRLLDDVLQVVWYQRQLHLIGRGQAPAPRLGRWSSVLIGVARLYAFNPLGGWLPRPRQRRWLSESHR
jgi:2,4-dienoyl-CoA reductase-like NADH-dependent reductase (Old Yellow Enzyme family)